MGLKCPVLSGCLLFPLSIFFHSKESTPGASSFLMSRISGM